MPDDDIDRVLGPVQPRSKTVSFYMPVVTPITGHADSPEIGLDDDDPFIAGLNLLLKWGYSREEIIVACVGYGSSGSRQVLVLGRSNVMLLDQDSQVLLDAGPREVRGVRLVDGDGVQVCVTASGPEGQRAARWDHRVPSAVARSLENHWLQWEPSMHNGVQLNKRPWREEEYARYVGRVLAEASSCDAQLSALLSVVKGAGADIDGKIYGGSGGQLAELLSGLGHSSPAFYDLAERYEAWYYWRNFSTHGVREVGANGHPTSRVFKMRRGPDSNGEIFDVEDQDFKDLALLWRAFYALGQDAARLRLRIQAPAESNINEVLRTLPVADTVSESERMPPR